MIEEMLLAMVKAEGKPDRSLKSCYWTYWKKITLISEM